MYIGIHYIYIYIFIDVDLKVHIKEHYGGVSCTYKHLMPTMNILVY